MGKNFKLLAHSLGTSHVDLQHNHIMLPAIKTLMTKEEQEFVQDNSKTVKTIKELERISLQEMNGNNLGIDMAELKSRT